MSMLPSVTDSGLALLARGERRLAESARGFTRAADGAGAPPTDAEAPASNAAATDSDLVDAAVGVIYGRSSFEIGLKLIEVGRDVEKALVDTLA